MSGLIARFATRATLGAELLAHLLPLGDGDAAVAIGVEALEALQGASAELVAGHHAVLAEHPRHSIAALTTLATLRPALGTLRAVLSPLGRRNLAVAVSVEPLETTSGAIATLALRTALGATLDTAGFPALQAALHALTGFGHRQATVAIDVEPGEAAVGTLQGLLTGDLGGGSASALVGLGGGDAAGRQQRAGEQSEVDGLHG